MYTQHENSLINKDAPLRAKLSVTAPSPAAGTAAVPLQEAQEPAETRQLQHPAGTAGVRHPAATAAEAAGCLAEAEEAIALHPAGLPAEALHPAELQVEVAPMRQLLRRPAGLPAEALQRQAAVPMLPPHLEAGALRHPAGTAEDALR